MLYLYMILYAFVQASAFAKVTADKPADGV